MMVEYIKEYIRWEEIDWEIEENLPPPVWQKCQVKKFQKKGGGAYPLARILLADRETQNQIPPYLGTVLARCRDCPGHRKKSEKKYLKELTATEF